MNKLYLIQVKFPFAFGDYIRFSKFVKLYNSPKFLKGKTICRFVENTSSTERIYIDYKELRLFCTIYYFWCSIWKEKYAAFFLSHSLTKLINFYLTNSQCQSPNKICMEGRYTLFCLVLQFWRRAWGNNRNPKSLFFSICSQKYSG